MAIKSHLKILVLICSLIILTGCSTRKFEVESTYNEFRNSYDVRTSNNDVKNSNVNGDLSFDLIKYTEPAQKKMLSTYGLLITTNAPYETFKEDSHIIIKLQKANTNSEEIHLVATDCSNETFKENHYSPAITSTTPVYSKYDFGKKHPTYQNNIVSPGYSYTTTTWLSKVIFTIPNNQISKFYNATAISFSLENSRGEAIRGVLSQKNLDNIQEFRNRAE